MKYTGILLALFLGASECMDAQETWSLTRCIDYAVTHNLTVKKREAACEQSEVSLSTARSSRLPDLNAGVNHSFNFGRSLQNDNTYKRLNTQNTGLNLSTNIPLFTGLRTVNQIALSKLDLKAAVADLESAKEDLSIQVASSYLELLFKMELSEVAHRQVELSKEMLLQKQAFYEMGKASKAEWLEAKARVAQDELSAVQSDNGCQMATLDLTQLLELATPEEFLIERPSDDILLDSITLVPPAEIYAEALWIKPSVKAAQYRLDGAAKNIRIAKSAYFPQLSLGAGLSTNYYNVSGRENGNFGSQLKDNFSQFIGITLSVPIFNRLATRNQVRSAKIKQVTLNWELEESKKALYKEIQQAYYNALNAGSQYRSSCLADETAQESFALVKEKYQNGKATASEYNESRTGWMKAVSDRIQAKYDYLFRTKILDFYRGVPLTLGD